MGNDVDLQATNAPSPKDQDPADPFPRQEKLEQLWSSGGNFNPFWDWVLYGVYPL